MVTPDHRHSLRRFTLWFALAAAVLPCLLGADEANPSSKKLDGATSAKMLAAITGLAILGIAMMLLTWLGFRFARRHMNPPTHQPTRSRLAEFGVDDWTEKPIAADMDEDDESA